MIRVTEYTRRDGSPPGRVLGGTHHVWVHRDGEENPGPYHPSDVRPVTS